MNLIKDLESAFHISLAESLWALDVDQMEGTIAGIYNVAFITGISVYDISDTPLVERGRNRSQDEELHKHGTLGSFEVFTLKGNGSGLLDNEIFKYTFPIRYNYGEVAEQIGHGVIYSDEQVLFSNIGSTLLTTFYISILKTLALWAVFLLSTRAYVIKPLSGFAELMAGAKIHDSDSDVTEKLDTLNQRKDEIGELSRRYSYFLEEVDEAHHVINLLNHNLERKVSQRTEELSVRNSQLQAFFDSIPVGVLIVGDAGLISNEYAISTEKILQTKEISGKTVDEVLFQSSELAHDDRGIAMESINAVIGYQAINFKLNKENFPEIIQYRGTLSKKTLELSWGYVLNAKGDVENLIVVINDITRIQELSLERSEKIRELGFIQKIIGLSPEQVQTQMESFAIPIEAIYYAKQPNSTEFLRQLHTLKGNARVFGYSNLSSYCHEAETLIVEQTSSQGDGWDIQFHRIVDEFRVLQKVALMLKKIERPLLFAEPQSGQQSSKVQQKPNALGEDRFDWMRNASSLKNLIHDDVKAATLLVKVKGKVNARFEVDDVALFQPYLRQNLKGCFGHLISNSIIHGFHEKKDENDQDGVIFIKVRCGDDEVRIKYSDNGKGLDLLGLGADKEIIDGMAGELSEDDTDYLQGVCAQIFDAGRTTVDGKNRDQMAGRGIGMNAVLSFIEQVQGQVRIVVSSPKDYRMAFCLEITLPGESVKSQSLSA